MTAFPSTFGLISLALLLASAQASAQVEGVDLSWNDCGAFGDFNRNFTCSGTTNQSYSLLLQFKIVRDLPRFVGMTAIVDLYTEPGTAAAPFWHYEIGGCNRSPVSGVALFDAIPPSCANACYADLWDGDGSGGNEALAGYAPDFERPGRGRFVLGAVHRTQISVKQGVNYFALELRFNNKNRDLCVGCNQRATLVFSLLTLESNDGQPDLNLGFASKIGNCALINGGLNPGPCDIQHPCPPFCLLATNPCDAVPARQGTWGSIKILYR